MRPLLPPPHSPERPQAVLRGARRCIAVLICVDAAWMWHAGIGVAWGGAWQPLAAGLIAAALFCNHWRQKSLPFQAAQPVLLLFLGAYALMVLCYLGATLRLPLVDPALIGFDHALGFDWRSYAAWIGRHPFLQGPLSLAYLSMAPQIFGLAIAFAATRRIAELQRFVLAFLLSLLISVIMATGWPGVAGYVFYDIHPASLGLHPAAARIHEHDMLALRAGTMRALPPQLKGIITFPSYHASMALLLIWASRSLKLWLPTGIAVNVLMLFSIPVDGGHWLADMAGGAAVIALTLRIVHFLLPERLASRGRAR